MKYLILALCLGAFNTYAGPAVSAGGEDQHASAESPVSHGGSERTLCSSTVGKDGAVEEGEAAAASTASKR